MSWDHNPYKPCFSKGGHWISKQLYLHSEKAMAPHSSTLAWKIPWMEEPGRLQSMGSLRVGYDWATSLSLFTFMHWRRKWQPTPVFLPGKSQGRGSLVGCSSSIPTLADLSEEGNQPVQTCVWAAGNLQLILATQWSWFQYFIESTDFCFFLFFFFLSIIF